MVEKTLKLHKLQHKVCFIWNSYKKISYKNLEFVTINYNENNQLSVLKWMYTIQNFFSIFHCNLKDPEETPHLFLSEIAVPHKTWKGTKILWTTLKNAHLCLNRYKGFYIRGLLKWNL